MRKSLFLFGTVVLLWLGSDAWGITGLGIGVRGGMIQNYKNDNLRTIPTGDDDWLKDMPMVGVHLKIGTLRIIHLEASLEYAWKEKEIVLLNLGRADFSISDVSLNGTAKYVYSLPVLKPYVGAGVGIHRLVYGISNDAFSVYLPGGQSKVGYHLVGGFEVSPPAFPLELLAEARYTSIQTDNDPTRYTTLLVGLTYKLP
jgi:opacity protein-like surface antigen